MLRRVMRGTNYCSWGCASRFPRISNNCSLLVKYGLASERNGFGGPMPVLRECLRQLRFVECEALITPPFANCFLQH